MIKNELLYNPDKHFSDVSKRLQDALNNQNYTKQLYELFVKLDKQLRYSCVSIDEYENLLKSTTFCDDVCLILELWPTKETKLSRAKTKLFAHDFTKFLSKTKKGLKLATNKITNILSMWAQEKIHFENELYEKETILQNIVTEYQKFFVEHGDWTYQQTNAIQFIKTPEKQRTCLSINYFEPNIWYAWPQDIEHISQCKYKSKDSGIGAGEEWLSFILGGIVQGSNSTFDIAIIQNDKLQRWEVKEYDEKTSQTIRLGSLGTNSTEDISLQFYDIMLQLKQFHSLYTMLGLSNDASELLKTIHHYVKSLSGFLSDFFSKIVIRGELSNIDLQELLPAIKGAATIVKKITLEIPKPTVKVIIDNKQHSCNELAVYNSLLIDECSFNEKIYKLLSTLQHPLLIGQMSYSEFIQSTLANLTPHSSFGDVDGVILVHKHGFRIIPQNSLNDSFDYVRLSQGRRPNFKVRESLIPQYFKQIGFFGYSYSQAMFGQCYTLLSGAIDTNIKYSDDQLFQKYSNWNFANIDASFWNKTQQLKIIDTNI